MQEAFSRVPTVLLAQQAKMAAAEVCSPLACRDYFLSGAPLCMARWILRNDTSSKIKPGPSPLQKDANRASRPCACEICGSFRSYAILDSGLLAKDLFQ